MANITKIYSDIDFTFLKKPGTGDVALSYDSQAVIRSVRNLIQTRNYDRPFNPDLGSTTESMLFEPISPLMAGSLENEIKRIINNYESRVNLQNVQVIANDDLNTYEVTITFFIANASLPTTISLLLERDR